MFKASDYPIDKPNNYEEDSVKTIENNNINNLKYHDVKIVSKEDSDQNIPLHYAYKYDS